MILLDPDLRFALRANALQQRAAMERCHDAAMRGDQPDPSSETHGSFDPRPVIKLFNPLGAATWLATELYEDGDTLFGLADLGFGCPEPGVFSLSEIASVRLPFGLGIERDTGFGTAHRLSVWAEWSRRTGSISRAEALLRRRP